MPPPPAAVRRSRSKPHASHEGRDRPRRPLIDLGLLLMILLVGLPVLLAFILLSAS